MGDVPEKQIQIIAFEDAIDAAFDDFLDVSASLGEPLIEFGFLLKDSFNKLKNLIEFGLYNEAPSNEAEFFSQQPLAAAIEAVSSFRNEHRQKDFSNHLSTVSESILALSWITVKPAPVPFIKELEQAGLYYGNRVLQTYKSHPNQNHVKYINKWCQILRNLELYVKQYFLTGFTWGSALGGMIQPNPQKCILTSALSAPAPPPPPPVPTGPREYNVALAGGDVNRNALLNELNQGTGITNRLRHINRHEIVNAPSPPSVPTEKNLSQYKKTPPAKIHQPKHILEGRKWIVAYQKNEPGITLMNDDMSQSLLMHDCDNTFVEIMNKINNVTIDSCKRTSLLVRGCISSIEVIRCSNVKIQIDGVVPLLNISGSDSCEFFVNETSKHVEVIASKSSSLNICLLKTDGDYIELPVPEQIRSIISGENKLKSTVVENI